MNPKAKDLNLMHINKRGLRRNFEELIFSLNEKEIYITSINETFFQPKKKIIPGYPIIRNDLVKVVE